MVTSFFLLTILQAAAATPTISSISPSSGSTSGGNTVTIDGTNLGFATAVTFGGTAATIAYNTSTGKLQPTVPAHAAGAVDVKVTTPGGTATATNGYTYAAPAPIISSISPNSGSTSGGYTVTIDGTDLGFATSVTFGGTAATIAYNTSTGKLQPTVPAHTAGAVDVKVTTPGGTATATNGYTYTAPAPTISSISPNSGSTSGGNTVTIDGTNLGFATSVTFGGTAATIAYNTSTGKLEPTVPAHAAGAVDVKVTTPGGTATATNGYTYVATSLLSIASTAFDPPSATVGKGYSANSAMTATGGQVPYSWSASGLPNGMFINSSTGAPYGTPTVAGPFSVTVTVKDGSNPQQAASKTLPLTVAGLPPRPDLAPLNVQVTPNSFKVGDAVTVSLNVTNQGQGNAVPTKTRLRINQSPTSTSPSDLPLGDIDTPSVSAGASVSLSKTIAISGVAAGGYYVWASVDNTNVAGQSDATNDYAHSPILTVRDGQITPPSTITITPNQTINAGQTARVEVSVSGGGSFSYRWYRNGVVLPFAVTSAINVSADGAYKAEVWTTGSASNFSPVCMVSVTPRTFTGAGSADEGALVEYRWVGPSAPTVVVTHGWQPSSADDYNQKIQGGWLNPPDSTLVIADAINARNDLTGINILLFVWKGAYTIGYGDVARAFVPTATVGHLLAADLVSLFGSTHTQPIHFVGHSFGTFVNAHAVDRLPWHVNQFTILDAPINQAARDLIGLSAGASASTFLALFGLPSAKIFYTNLDNCVGGWVDNYLATVREGGLLLFGDKVLGSAPNDGEYVPGVKHTTIQQDFYAPSVALVSQDGFSHSILVHPGFASDLSNWHPPQQLIPNRSDSINSLGIAVVGYIDKVYDTIDGETQSVLRFLNTSGVAAASLSGRLGTRLTEGLNGTNASSSGDASAQFNVSIPNDATAIRFRFDYPSRGDGDSLTVSFNDQTIYSFTGKNFFGDGYDAAEIPVSFIAGQTGVFTFTLHQVSSVPADLRIGDIHFVEDPAGVTTTEAQLGNISTRMNVGTGGNVLIGGFIVQGTSPKKILIRAQGPSLPSQVGNRITNPSIELHDTSQVIARNDNWQTTQIGGVITADQATDIQNSTLAPGNPAESAMIVTLPPGQYTAIVQGPNGETGVGTVEAYDLDSASSSSLANISTRGSVQTGGSVLIGGFIVQGTLPKKLLIRAQGPSLPASVGNRITNPSIELHDTSQVIARNDDWETTHIGGVITADQVTDIQNSTLAPGNPAESAMIVTLPPGQYTAIVQGPNGETGVGTVEVYEAN